MVIPKSIPSTSVSYQPDKGVKRVNVTVQPGVRILVREDRIVSGNVRQALIRNRWSRPGVPHIRGFLVIKSIYWREFITLLRHSPASFSAFYTLLAPRAFVVPHYAPRHPHD